MLVFIKVPYGAEELPGDPVPPGANLTILKASGYEWEFVTCGTLWLEKPGNYEKRINAQRAKGLLPPG